MSDTQTERVTVATETTGHASAKVIHLTATRPANARLPREKRIDVFRGLALIMIFINHAPKTVYENFTSRNFGFSDAAEAFVFISGTSAALAYAGVLQGPRLWPGVSRMWGRAWTLYLVHLMVTVWAIGIAAATLRLGGSPALMVKDNINKLMSDMTGVLTGLPILSHQIGYVNILPLYTAFLLVGPGLILLGLRWPRLLLAASVALWAASGIYYIDVPNFPNPGGWFLNPFSWQLLFVLGLLTGLALRRGERFIPRHPVLIAVTGAFVVLSAVWLKVPAVQEVGNQSMVRLANLGLPPLVHAFDKTYLTMPRLLHVLALVYVVSALPFIARACASRYAEPLALLGRQALPVFAFGTILSFSVRSVKAVAGDSLALDSLLIGAGIVLMLVLAKGIEFGRKAAKTA